MFKMIAALAVAAGGAGYGIYTYTDLLGGESSGGCPLARKTCCQTESVVGTESDCCLKQEQCCEVVAPCCATASRAAAVAKAAPCCAVPCPACADDCDGCPLCAVDCGECCGLTAQVAVGGPAGAVFAAKK